MTRKLAIPCALLAAGLAAAGRSPAQTPTPGAATPRAERVLPRAVVPPPEFQAAVQAGTRTNAGRPGPRYWQNWADYRIRARVFPDAKRLEGSATIRYQNRSPATLRALALELVQNFHAPGAVRLEPAEVTGGVQLSRVQVNGATAVATPGGAGARYEVDGTKMLLYLAQPLPPGGSVELAVDWSFTIPKAGASGRMGHDGENLIYLAYFYPQLTVFDDVVGWQLDPFLGGAEFYAGFGNYDVTIEAPQGWVVMGTGQLTNPEQTLAPGVLARLRAAEQSDTVVHVIREADFGSATRPAAAGGVLAWTFEADSVRDVAYSLTRESLWDAARASVGDRDGDGRADYTRADAIYRPRARRWASVVRYAQHSLSFLSRNTGYAYPWSHMTAVEGEGIIGGGMEYPMMTLIGDYTAAGDDALYGVTLHEIAHMWIPMIAASDERRYSWLDEGTTSFNENQGRRDFLPGRDPAAGDRATYVEVATAGQEGEIMRRSDYHYPGPAYVIASYYKPSLLLDALRAVLGEETFDRAFREFFDRWAFKHPYPWDFWNTFEEVSGRDLDWFWSTWYYETATLDQAVESVTTVPEGTRIVVRDHGDAPMPVLLAIRLASGEEVRREIPVESWLTGARTATLTIPGQATRVQIDPEQRFPDVRRENNLWSR